MRDTITRLILLSPVIFYAVIIYNNTNRNFNYNINNDICPVISDSSNLHNFIKLNSNDPIAVEPHAHDSKKWRIIRT